MVTISYLTLNIYAAVMAIDELRDAENGSFFADEKMLPIPK